MSNKIDTTDNIKNSKAVSSDDTQIWSSSQVQKALEVNQALRTAEIAVQAEDPAVVPSSAQTAESAATPSSDQKEVAAATSPPTQKEVPTATPSAAQMEKPATPSSAQTAEPAVVPSDAKTNPQSADKAAATPVDQAEVAPHGAAAVEGEDLPDEVVPKKSGKILPVIGFVFGIFSFAPLVGLAAGVAGLILCIKGLAHSKRGLAAAGIFLNIVGVLLNIAYIIVYYMVRKF